MLDNLVLRNSTNFDFEIAFEEKTVFGYQKTSDQRSFLLAKSFRIFKQKHGKKHIRFFYQSYPGKEFADEFNSPGYFELKQKKGDLGVVIKEEKISLEDLNAKINSFFGESEDFAYEIESSRFKDVLKADEKKRFMFAKKEKVRGNNTFPTFMNSNSTNNTRNFYTGGSNESKKDHNAIAKIEANKNDQKYISNQIIPNVKNFIEFTNNSKTKIFVRLNSDDNSDNYLKEAEKHITNRWFRNTGEKFLLQLERTKNLKKGPVYEVCLSESYFLDINNQLRLKNGEELVLSKNKFSENLNSPKFSEDLAKKTKENELQGGFQNFAWLKKIKISKMNFFGTLVGKKHWININNLSRNAIKTKVYLDNDKENNNKFVEYEIINFNSSFRFKKNQKGNFKLEITREENDEKGSEIKKQFFYVKTGNSYSFNSFSVLVHDNNGKVVNEVSSVAAENNFNELGNELVLVAASRTKNLVKSAHEKVHVHEENHEEKEKAKGDKISQSHDYYKNLSPDYTPEKQFKDLNFPATLNSILALDNTGKKRILPHFPHLPPEKIEDEVHFLSPKQIFKENEYKLFKDKIEANDVLQGELGNCYLMSIISAMGQRPDLILEAFRSKKTNADGFYQIYFYDIDGSRKILFVDHFFPFIKKAGKLVPLGARPHDAEIWVMILEKAYAKYEGGYVNINGGTIIDELFWLTGSFCQEMDLHKSKHAWENLRIVCGKKNIVCCKSNKGSGKHSQASAGNIANSHAYSILGAEEFKGIRLLTLRNPWGDTEWKGEFSDEDSKSWTPELKEYFGFEVAKGENGVFFMKFEDFKEEFNNVIICFC